MYVAIKSPLSHTSSPDFPLKIEIDLATTPGHRERRIEGKGGFSAQRLFREIKPKCLKKHQADHDSDKLDPDPVVVRCCTRIYVVQIQPRKVVLDHADYTALTRLHDLDHTYHTDDAEPVFPIISTS